MSFFWGETPSLTPGGVRRKRDTAEAILASMNTPKNVGEGLSHVGKALIAKSLNNKAEKSEAAGRERAEAMFRSLITGEPLPPRSSDTGPMTVNGIPPRTPEQEIGDDTMAAIGKPDAMSSEGRIRQGMIDRGLPEHVADAFVMNFRDESGLNPGINEHNPIVPGSRGGFGLAQWTGPRRVALEQFATAQGKPVDDLDVQLDFLVNEMQGSESAAGRTILSTRNAPEAAAAIVNDFLRPSEQHRARREANYLGAQQTAPDNSRLYAALADPWLDQAQKSAILGMIQQNQQAADPMRQIQLQTAQAQLDRLQNPQAGFSVLTDAEEAQMGLDTAGSYQRGADGKISQIGGRGTSITLTNEGTIPQGFRAVRDANGNLLSYEAVPGGPEDTSAQDALAADAKATSANIVLDEIGIARDLIAGESTLSPATGITGSIASTIDSTRAGALKNRLTTIKANIGFDKLQAMRDASPTGGALGQVSEFENRLLQSVFGSLEQAQSAEDIQYNLDRLEGLYNRVINEGIPDDEARDMYRQIELGGRNRSVDFNLMNADDINKMIQNGDHKSWDAATRRAAIARLKELR